MVVFKDVLKGVSTRSSFSAAQAEARPDVGLQAMMAHMPFAPLHLIYRRPANEFAVGHFLSDSVELNRLDIS